MGHFDVVWFLAEKGADLKAPHKDHVGGGHNALILSAVRHRSVEALQKLKAHGVDLDTRHWNGNSALHEAARSGEKEIVAWLVKSGANISAINDSGEGPVAEAASMGDPHPRPHPHPTRTRTRTCAACGYCRRRWRATASEGRISRSARSSRPLSARRQREWPE